LGEGLVRRLEIGMAKQAAERLQRPVIRLKVRGLEIQNRVVDLLKQVHGRLPSCLARPQPGGTGLAKNPLAEHRLHLLRQGSDEGVPGVGTHALVHQALSADAK
jgi:hypothetical protein